MRGKKSLLKNINRRRSCHVQQIGGQIVSSDETGKYGTECEIQKLKREEDLMKDEIVQLRQEHVMTVQQIDALNQRMQSAELRQKQMVSFLAKVLQNQVFFDRLKKLKEEREIGPMRVRRKFLKHQQPMQSKADELLDKQIEKYRVDSSASVLSGVEHDKGSASSLAGYEHSGNYELLDHPLQDLVDRVGFDTGGQDIIRGSGGTEDVENNLLSSHTDVGFADADNLISLPDDATPEAVISDDSPTLTGERMDRLESDTYAFNGVNVMNFETDGDGGGDIEYLTAFLDDTSQERMLQDDLVPRNDFASEAGFWNVDVEDGSSLSAGIDVWDNIRLVDDSGTELADGSCPLWDLGLHTIEEVLDITDYVGGESSLQEHKDDVGRLIEDGPRQLEA